MQIYYKKESVEIEGVEYFPLKKKVKCKWLRCKDKAYSVNHHGTEYCLSHLQEFHLQEIQESEDYQ